MRGAWLLALTACGRIGFAGSADSGVIPADGSRDGARKGPIQYVGVFSAGQGVGGTETFGASAAAAGDLVVVQVTCIAATGVPTGVSITAPGWTFTALSSPAGSGPVFSALFTAVTPDSQPTNLLVTWSASTCEGGMTTLGDEFRRTGSGDNATAAPVGFGGLGNCDAGTISTVDPSDAVWAACSTTNGTIDAIDPAYAPAATVSPIAGAAYRITTDTAATPEHPTFTSNGSFWMDVVLVRPE